MKCSNCCSELIFGAKFCPECGTPQVQTCKSCGTPLKKDARFCGECGAKVEGVSELVKDLTVPSIDLSPLPSGLDECTLKIIEFSVEGPDPDGDFRGIEVKYVISNNSHNDWDYLSVRLQLLSAAGNIIEETTDNHETIIVTGSSEEFCSRFFSVKAKALDIKPEKAHIVVSVLACRTDKQDLGQVSIPTGAYEIVTLKPVKIGTTLQLVGFSLWKGEPGDDKESRIEVKVLLQNLTNLNMPLVKLSVDIKDKSGEVLTDAGGSDEVRQASISSLSGSGWVKERKLNGATTDLAISATIPVASGFSQLQGLVIIPPNQDSVDSDDSDDENEKNENEDDENSIDRFGITAASKLAVAEKEKSMKNIKTFYGNMEWFEPAEQPNSLADCPEQLQIAKKLWDKNSVENFEEIKSLLMPFVGARFIASNISNWEELFLDPEGDGFVEIEANKVEIVSIDFTKSPIPMCKAEAWFQVEVTDNFASTDLDDWQENNSWFTDAISFYWKFPENDATDDLDLTFGDNLGVECVIIESDK